MIYWFCHICLRDFEGAVPAGKSECGECRAEGVENGADNAGELEGCDSLVTGAADIRRPDVPDSPG